MWNGINRRRFPRANYNCTITIKSGGEVPKTIITQTENIGMGGICVVLKESINLFKDGELEIIIEDKGSPIRCKGSIVWVVKKTDPTDKSLITYDVGIEFIDIDDSDKDRIGRIVEKILSTA